MSLIIARALHPAVTTVDAPRNDRIRPAVRADLMAVVRIERRVFPEPWRLSSFEQFLHSPGFLVMEDPTGAGIGDDLAGYVVADVLEVSGTEVGHVKDLAVKPELQGAGRGRALLERSLAVLSSHGAGLARLEVRPSNERAIDLYRQYGFEVKRRRSDYYPDGEDALVLARPLGDRDRF